ncbi:MAG: hypothetical protein ACYCUI_13960 [Vulcanimicrobiaceae bacterium]
MRAQDVAACMALEGAAGGAIWGADDGLAQVGINQHPGVGWIMREALEAALKVSDRGHGCGDWKLMRLRKASANERRDNCAFTSAFQLSNAAHASP